MQSDKLTLETKISYAQGYGGPSGWTVNLVGNNKNLETGFYPSELIAHQAAAKMLVTWRAKSREPNFFETLVLLPDYYAICGSCGVLIKSGGSHCLESYWCDKCLGAGKLEAALKKYNQDMAAREPADAELDAQKQAADAAAILLARTGFHWRDGVYFRRGDCGETIMSIARPGARWPTVFTIPENEWASIVCSVSADGETGERWRAARLFHGLKDLPDE